MTDVDDLDVLVLIDEAQAHGHVLGLLFYVIRKIRST